MKLEITIKVTNDNQYIVSDNLERVLVAKLVFGSQPKWDFINKKGLPAGFYLTSFATLDEAKKQSLKWLKKNKVENIEMEKIN